MSKQNIKKFRKNDYSYDDNEEYNDNPKNRINKYEAKRVDRALKTKDISALIEDEDEWDDYIPFEGSGR
jgi:hypothetical protein